MDWLFDHYDRTWVLSEGTKIEASVTESGVPIFTAVVSYRAELGTLDDAKKWAEKAYAAIMASVPQE